MLSPESSKLLNLADKLSQKNQDQYISSESVLLAAMQDKGAVGKLLNTFSVSANAIETAVKNLRGGATVDNPEDEDKFQDFHHARIHMNVNTRVIWLISLSI